MHVEQVEAVDFGYLGHARGQRQIVRRILEQRIVGDVHLVKVDVGALGVQPDGLPVRDEVDLMSAVCQLHPQFGGHHPAAAVGGITCDSDLHAVLEGLDGGNEASDSLTSRELSS